MDKERHRISSIQAQARRELEGYEFTIEADIDGHESFLCKHPDRCEMWFRVIKAPDTLIYTGDMGEFVFVRPGCSNMLGWFNTSLPYVQEKCRAGNPDEWNWEHTDDWLDQFGLELLRADVDSIAYQIEGYQQIRAFLGDESGEHEFYSECFDALPEMEWGDILPIRQFTLRFLWCVEAVNWLKKAVGQQQAQAEVVAS